MAGIGLGLHPGVNVVQAQPGTPASLPSPYLTVTGAPEGGGSTFNLADALAAFTTTEGIYVTDTNFGGINLIETEGPIAMVGPNAQLVMAANGFVALQSLNQTNPTGLEVLTAGGVALTDDSANGVMILQQGTGWMVFETMGGGAGPLGNPLGSTYAQPGGMSFGASGPINMLGSGTISIAGSGLQISDSNNLGTISTGGSPTAFSIVSGAQEFNINHTGSDGIRITGTAQVIVQSPPAGAASGLELSLVASGLWGPAVTSGPNTGAYAVFSADFNGRASMSGPTIEIQSYAPGNPGGILIENVSTSDITIRNDSGGGRILLTSYGGIETNDTSSDGIKMYEHGGGGMDIRNLDPGNASQFRLGSTGTLELDGDNGINLSTVSGAVTTSSNTGTTIVDHGTGGITLTAASGGITLTAATMTIQASGGGGMSLADNSPYGILIDQTGGGVIQLLAGPSVGAGGIIISSQHGTGGVSISAYDNNTISLVAVSGSLKVNTANLGFYNATPVAKQTVTGSKGGNAAVASIMAALVALGLVTDSTT